MASSRLRNELPSDPSGNDERFAVRPYSRRQTINVEIIDKPVPQANAERNNTQFPTRPAGSNGGKRARGSVGGAFGKKNGTYGRAPQQTRKKKEKKAVPRWRLPVANAEFSWDRIINDDE